MLNSIYRLKILATTIAIGFSTVCFGQYEKDYTPLEYSSVFPETFSENYEVKIKTLLDNEQHLSKKRARKFYEDLYQQKAQRFTSGQIYFENKLHAYVNNVASKLCAQNHSLLKKVNIYVSRSTAANAFAMPDGTIVINVGRLARFENESQLAAILAHEIAHVELQHSVKSLSKLDQIESQQVNFVNEEGEIFRSLRFSREDEFEADSRAVQLLMASDYDPYEVPKALSIIGNDDYFKIDSLKQRITSVLLTDNIVPIDTTWFKKDQSSGSTSDNSDIIFTSDNEDLYSTHPDIAKRISATKEILDLIEVKGAGKMKNLLGKQSEEIKTMAMFECIEGMLRDSEYNTALYLSLYALEKFPKNMYLKTAIVESLYWLSFYKEINSVKKVFENSGEACRENFDQFNLFLEKIPHNDLKKVMFTYLKKNLDQCQSKDDYYFYYGLCSEMYLGKDPGKLIFSQYQNKFPYGKYSNTVKAKLQ